MSEPKKSSRGNLGALLMTSKNPKYQITLVHRPKTINPMNDNFKGIWIHAESQLCTHDKLTDDNGKPFCPLCNPPF
jgi:hypothetical protein